MARPTVISDEVKQRLCELIAEGLSVREACAADDMPAPSTIYLALAKDAGFSEQYARAKVAQAERFADEILEISDNATNDWMARQGDNGEEFQVANHEHIQRSKLRVDSRKWLMSKMAPKKYGDRTTLAGDEENPITYKEVGTAYDVIASRISSIAARANVESDTGGPH